LVSQEASVAEKNEPRCAASGRESSLTISAKPVGVGAACQRLIPTGEQSSLLTRIATMENALLCVRMKS
jgi:hypothetical protein